MEKVAIVYWSGTGNTEAMARYIAQGVTQAGGQADVFSVSETSPEETLAYAKIALGCPSMGDEVLEEGEFAPFFEALEAGLSGKQVALFGSYGWGDGEWMRSWVKQAREDGALVFQDGLIAQDAPEEAPCVAFGKGFVEA